MVAANRQGPTRSPTVLVKPSAASANADAHWPMEFSHAPTQTISKVASQKTGSRNSSTKRAQKAPMQGEEHG